MARIIPNLDESGIGEIKSKAEAKIYRKCSELDQDCIVLFSVPWVSVTSYGTPRDGETDFVVIHETKGILVVEVKGGGIKYDAQSASWTTRNSKGEVNSIKDPFRQATNSKYELRKYLQSQEEWDYLKLNPIFAHAVFFPDLSRKNKLEGLDRPVQIIGNLEDLDAFKEWVSSVFEYWAGESAERTTTKLGSKGMGAIERILCKDIDAQPLLSAILEGEESERIRLTSEQTRIIDGLKLRKRAAISGGAGTGKTLLALHKAKELSAQGKRTLLLCYNSPLGNQLIKQANAVENLDAMSFHQLCKWFVGMAKTNSGHDFFQDAISLYPGESEFDFCWPMALANSMAHVKYSYDAVVIDEAQDFGDDYWLPISELIGSEGSTTLFIFYDHNQVIYRPSSYFPIHEPPFLLSRNCRNTQNIHKVAYQFYKGMETECSTIRGDEIEFLDAPTRPSQAKKIHNRIVELLSKEGLSATDICVLVPSRSSSDYIDLLSSKSLPGIFEWGIKEFGEPNRVCIETVMRFKGLEAN